MTMLDAPPKGAKRLARSLLRGGKTGCLKGSVNYPRDKKAILTRPLLLASWKFRRNRPQSSMAGSRK